MSTLAMPRGSQVTELPVQPAENLNPTQAGDGSVPGVRSTAPPPNPERVKQKPSTTMTTTASPPVETTTVPRVDATPRTTTRSLRPRRMRTFLAGLMDDRLDRTALQREALLRLQLR